MVYYFERNQIDNFKYDNCIKLAVNSRIYAYSWYLDIVADHWSALVLNDYEAVMPLPWRSKYFIKYVCPPAWTQQLGVFSKNEISQNVLKEFVSSIPKKFKKVTIQFNSQNDLSLFKTQKRVNYILPLNKDYEEIYKGFRSDLKSRINQANKNELLIKNCSFKELQVIAKQDYAFLKISDSNYNRLKSLTKFIIKNEKGFLLGVYNVDKKLLGGAIFLKEANRVSYLFSVVTSEGKKQQATSFLLNEVIQNHAKSSFILDFEGSMISGIASFFKSFGVKNETYFLHQKHFDYFKKS